MSQLNLPQKELYALLQVVTAAENLVMCNPDEDNVLMELRLTRAVLEWRGMRTTREHGAAISDAWAYLRSGSK